MSSRMISTLRRATTHLLRVEHRPLTLSSIKMNGQAWHGVRLSELPKSHNFTTHLPPDPLIPTPQASKEASPEQLRTSRPVKSALFTWVAPEKNENSQLLVTSWKAVKDLGLNAEEVKTEDFRNLMSGNKIYDEHYPWGEPRPRIL